MRAQEFVTDEINKQVFSPGWTDETTILNRYVLKARAADDWNKYQKLDIDVFDPEGEIPFRIAYARFRIKPGFFFQKNLEASMIYVSQEYQKRGIATAIYQYVRKLGNTIKPSKFQLPAGKSMWKSFDRTDALAEEFDGPTAAGCIVVAEDTGRWCLQQRSNTVSEPGVWSTWGGGREPGESVTETVLRELAEESGYQGITKLELIDTNQDYATFLAHVPREFEPQINHECQDWRWSDPDQLPKPLHPGLTQTLSKNFETFNNVVSEQDVLEDATVTRIDSKPIADFSSGLKAYKHTDDWSQSGIDTGDDSYWKNKNLKTNTTKGLFAGDPRRTALYATGNAHETRYVEFTQNGQPIVYFDKKDLPAMRSRKTYLTVFDASNFRQLPTGEWFSKNPGKPIKQTPIGDPFKYIADQGWIVRVTDDLDKVFNQVKKMHNAGKIAQYGAEGMNESLGVAENFADGKVKGKSRPGRVKRAGASCAGSVTDLRAKANKASGERARMYHWCANMKSGKKKNK